jgi:hypothetical protein
LLPPGEVLRFREPGFHAGGFAGPRFRYIYGHLNSVLKPLNREVAQHINYIV